MDSSYSAPAEVLTVDELGVSARAQFLVRTYGHLFGAMLGFTLLEVLFFTTGMAEAIAGRMLAVNWLWILGGFVLVSWFASRTAHRAVSQSAQYFALCGFVLAEALIFVPLLYMANYYAPGAISTAAPVTLLAFAGLTGIVFWTRKDFSFVGGLLKWAFVVALLAIVGGVAFGFQLGTWFSVGMVGLAGGAILHDTSRVLHHYPEDRYVAASLELFASMALMFWYVLSLFMNRD